MKIWTEMSHEQRGVAASRPALLLRIGDGCEAGATPPLQQVVTKERRAS